jgi:predicted glycoside hydrolase/deacetylase ChbG (UPF0249 family)
MSHLIVNADDFGLAAGINRGIIEAHERGIVTSTSLMVDEPGSEEAARLGGESPALSVGLHVKLTGEDARPVIDLSDQDALVSELRRQTERFRALVGRDPAHIDSHHNVHLLPEAAASFGELAESHGVTLRGVSEIRYFPSFFGQWDGVTHLEQIGFETLLEMIEHEFAEEGFTELGCHPGYFDSGLDSSYAIERETELRTLCDPRVRAKLDELGVELCSSSAARELMASPAGG